jgi:hypothetical protein
MSYAKVIDRPETSAAPTCHCFPTLNLGLGGFSLAALYSVPSGRQETLQRYDIDPVMVRRDTSLAGALE